MTHTATSMPQRHLTDGPRIMQTVRVAGLSRPLKQVPSLQDGKPSPGGLHQNLQRVRKANKSIANLPSAPLRPVPVFTRRPFVAPDHAEGLFGKGLIDSGSCVSFNESAQQVYCLPSLICIGMAKAGTEELRGWMAMHPNISMSPSRETQFFNKILPQRVRSTHTLTNEKHMLQLLASSWTEYARMFPVERASIGTTMTMEKSAGYSHIRRNASNAGDIPKLVPKLLARMAPNVRLVVLLRDPATVVRSRFAQCLLQMSKHVGQSKQLSLTKCGGASDADFERMLVGSRLICLNSTGGPTAAAGLGARDVIAARMGGPAGLLLVEDPLVVLREWSTLHGQRLLVLFTEQLFIDAKAAMNKLLVHVGLPRYHWPKAQLVPNSDRFTYNAAKSKSTSTSTRYRKSQSCALSGQSLSQSC
uniref:Sulfotransferase domain-containing protein n=1 Tax=Chrysotila carterae TaxID=13221 RepID=A0A7S4B5D5_CHRCT